MGSEVLSRESFFNTLYALADGGLGGFVENDYMLRVEASHEALRERVEELEKALHPLQTVTGVPPAIEALPALDLPESTQRKAGMNDMQVLNAKYIQHAIARAEECELGTAEPSPEDYMMWAAVGMSHKALRQAEDMGWSASERHSLMWETAVRQGEMLTTENRCMRERVEKLEAALHRIANRDGVPPVIEALVALDVDNE